MSEDKPDGLTADWIRDDTIMTLATWDGWTNMLPDGTQRRIGPVVPGEGYIDVDFGDPYGSRKIRRMRITIAVEDLDQRYELGDVVSLRRMEHTIEGTVQGIVRPEDPAGEPVYLVGVVDKQKFPLRRKASELTLVRRGGEA